MNKKLIRSILAGLLVLLLAASVAGCGIARRGEAPAADNGGSLDILDDIELPTEEEEEDTIEGTYWGEVDMTDMIAEEAGVEISSKLAMGLFLTIGPDDAYLIEADLEKFISDTIDYYNAEMPALIRQMMVEEGIPEDMLEETVKAQGYESFDAFVKELLDEMIVELEESMAEEDSVLSEGTYEISGDKITLSESSGDASISPVGTINSDGTISFDITTDEQVLTIVFEK